MTDITTLTDDEVREKLAYYNHRIAESQSRYGHSNLRSDRSLLSEAYNYAYPWQEEAKRRGISASRLADVLDKMSDRSLRTLHNCAKKRASHWFKDPRAMLVLRTICQRRGLLDA
jgi:hypothetical protein